MKKLNNSVWQVRNFYIVEIQRKFPWGKQVTSEFFKERNVNEDQETVKDFDSLIACLPFFLCCKLCITFLEQTKIYLH